MKILIIFAFILSKFSYSSALVKKDDSTNTLKVISRLVFSGPELTDELAQAATQEVSDVWNENPVHIKLGKKVYLVQFEVDYILGGKQKLKNRTSCAYMFFKIKKKDSTKDRSFIDSTGSRRGVLYIEDDIGNSTTVAHEYGHGLTLDHPGNLVQDGLSNPGIMFPRGTMVIRKYRRDPKAFSHELNGTLDPALRKARAQDIHAIPFYSVIFNENNRGCLGDGYPEKID